jgi:hypothetical protein
MDLRGFDRKAAVAAVQEQQLDLVHVSAVATDWAIAGNGLSREAALKIVDAILQANEANEGNTNVNNAPVETRVHFHGVGRFRRFNEDNNAVYIAPEEDGAEEFALFFDDLREACKRLDISRTDVWPQP